MPVSEIELSAKLLYTWVLAVNVTVIYFSCRHNKRGVKPVERLWNYLVRQEHVQEVFVRYIFGRKRPAPEPTQYSDHG